MVTFIAGYKVITYNTKLATVLYWYSMGYIIYYIASETLVHYPMGI